MLNHVTLTLVSLGLLSCSLGRLWKLMRRGAMRVERDLVWQRTCDMSCRLRQSLSLWPLLAGALCLSALVLIPLQRAVVHSAGSYPSSLLQQPGRLPGGVC